MFLDHVNSIVSCKVHPKKPKNNFTANNLQQLLSDADSPLFWGDIVREAKNKGLSDIRLLRKELKMLNRSGRVHRSESGAFSYIDESSLLRGRVESRGRFLHCKGFELVHSPGLQVRKGDEIEGFVQEAKFVINKILELSADSIVASVEFVGSEVIALSLNRNVKGRVYLRDSKILSSSNLAVGDIVEVKLITKNRLGFVGELIDKIESHSVADLAIQTTLRNLDIPKSWPAEVEQVVESFTEVISPQEYRTRLDLTSLPFITIDGETAKDFDDAVYAEPFKDGGWRILIAIADVGHYVTDGSPIDIEARNRGTSVYFPEFVVPMLPEELSNDRCSLVPDEDRLVIVCEAFLYPGHSEPHFQFHEAIIKSKARTTYHQVEEYYCSGKFPGQADAGVLSSLDCLRDVYFILQRKRIERGALDISTSEALLELSSGSVVALKRDERNDTHHLIEELMLLANVCAAKFLEKNSRSFLYRNHESPDILKWEQLRKSFATLGISVGRGDLTPKTVQNLLSEIAMHRSGEIYQHLVLKSLQQAMYEPDKKGHFGLALDSYTHFTSPIRRYPDLLAHRAIKSILRGIEQAEGAIEDNFINLGLSCSQTERRAEAAGWAVDAWLKCDYLLDLVGETVDGFVAGVTEFGLFVELRGYFIQGLLHVTNLGNDYYKYYPNRVSLVGESSGQAFSLGDQIRVKIASVEPAQGKIDLIVESSSQKKAKGKKRLSKHRRRRGRTH